MAQMGYMRNLYFHWHNVTPQAIEARVARVESRLLEMVGCPFATLQEPR